MPDFWKYWERARKAAPGDRYRLFEEMVQKPHAAVYEGAFANAPIPPSEFVTAALNEVPRIETRMRALSGRLAADLPSELAAFRNAFPKFECSVPVYFLFSGGAFDGATRDVSGKTALMFGLDVIAKLDEQLSPLVVHELFHVYHGQVVPEDPETFSWGLWTEGLATYVSEGYDASYRSNVRDAIKDGTLMPLDGLTGQYGSELAIVYAVHAHAPARSTWQMPRAVRGRAATRASNEPTLLPRPSPARKIARMIENV